MNAFIFEWNYMIDACKTLNEYLYTVLHDWIIIFRKGCKKENSVLLCQGN